MAQCASLEGSLAALVQRVEQNEREPAAPVTERAVKHDVSLLVDAVQASSVCISCSNVPLGSCCLPRVCSCLKAVCCLPCLSCAA